MAREEVRPGGTAEGRSAGGKGRSPLELSAGVAERERRQSVESKRETEDTSERASERLMGQVSESILLE